MGAYFTLQQERMLESFADKMPMMGDTIVSWSAGGDLACVLVSRRAIGRSFLVIQERKQSGDLRKRVLLAFPASSSFDDSQWQELPKRALIIVSDDKDQ